MTPDILPLDMDVLLDAGRGKTPLHAGPHVLRPNGVAAPKHSSAHITTEPRY